VTNQRGQEDYEDEEEDEGEEDREEEYGEDGDEYGDEDDDQERNNVQEDDDEIANDQETNDRTLGRFDSAAAHQLLSEAHMQRDVAGTVAGHECHSHVSLREQDASTPADPRPRSRGLGLAGGGFLSLRGSARESSNPDEEGKRTGPTGTQNLTAATGQEPPLSPASGTHGELVLLTALDQMSHKPLPAHGSVLESRDQDLLAGASTNHQFLMDMSLSFRKMLAAARAGGLLSTGRSTGQDVPLQTAHSEPVQFHVPGPANSIQRNTGEGGPFSATEISPTTGHASPSEIAKRALSLNLGLQYDEEGEEDEEVGETFSSGWSFGHSASTGASQADKEPEEPTRGPPSPPTLTDPPPLSLTDHHQLGQWSAAVHTATSQQTRIPPLAAIAMQARSLSEVEVQRHDANQIQHGFAPSPVVSAHRTQQEFLPDSRYSLAQPLPASLGPLPAPTPHLAYPVPHQTGRRLPPLTHPMYRFAEPMRPGSF
jgi:hypothetical protein